MHTCSSGGARVWRVWPVLLLERPHTQARLAESMPTTTTHTRACTASTHTHTHLHGLYAERIVQRLERDDEARRGAVRVRDDEAARGTKGWLGPRELEVVAIDWGHDEGHVRAHAVGGRVREHGDARVAEGDLDVARRARVLGGGGKRDVGER